ncbi:MAG: thioredoxin domain-containing protein, partial [Candidatus Acidiferrales bacterium]
MARLTLERLSITILLVLVGVSLPQAEQPQKPDQVVALVNGKPITLSEVDGRAGARLSRLSSQIYELRQVFLNELIGEMLLEEEATTQGVSLEDYKEQLLKSAEVTDAEVDEIIRQMYPPEASGNDVLRERVRLQVEDNRKRDLLKSKREELRKSAQIEVLLTRPVVPPVHVGTGHRRPLGNPDGSITVVEFADFQCDHCRAAAPVVKQVLTTHGHQVRYFYRHFPLP